MQTKHFFNDPDQVLALSLRSLAILRPNLSLDLENKTVYNDLSEDSSSKVSIISGGGAGHEPSFTGLVGDGLLAAAVSGSVFASPNSRQVLQAIRNIAANGTKGVLVTVMRYTGDVLNFGVALEKARTEFSSLKIKMLVVNDDVSLTKSQVGRVGRRGIAGTVLVHKVTGALAAKGYDLDDVLRVGQLAADNTVSMGVSLNRVHVPGSVVEEGKSTTEIELGMGIHNESGCGKREGKGLDTKALIGDMLGQLLDSKDTERNYLPSKPNEVVVMVNNLGALSVLELGAIVSEVVGQIQSHWKLRVARVYAGTFMTSLDGPGFSISLLNLVDTGVQESFLDLLNASSNAPGWSSINIDSRGISRKLAGSDIGTRQASDRVNLSCDLKAIIKRLEDGLQRLITAEPEITEYDSIVGDGDCGITLKRGALAIREELKRSPPATVIDLLTRIASTVEETMDGTSGALYAIFTNALIQAFRQYIDQAVDVDCEFWARVLSAAVAALQTYTPAIIGDRTMMDALLPFSETLRSTKNPEKAAKAATEGVEKTKNMQAALGRAVYVGNKDSWLGKIPDPGAYGLAQFLVGISSK